MDEKYFTLQNGNLFIPKDILVYYIDPKFSTTHSGLMARVIANQKLMVYWKNALDRIAHGENPTVYPQTPLNWTKSKAALIELIYALYWNKAINHGNIDIKKIVPAFEMVFKVQLLNPYKVYTEIKSRKKTKTKFLEELISVMDTKINEII